MSETEKAQQLFSRLCHDYGALTYQISRMTADAEDLRVKLRNAEVDYRKAKASETPANGEATDSPGVTQ